MLVLKYELRWYSVDLFTPIDVCYCFFFKVNSWFKMSDIKYDYDSTRRFFNALFLLYKLKIGNSFDAYDRDKHFITINSFSNRHNVSKTFSPENFVACFFASVLISPNIHSTTVILSVTCTSHTTKRIRFKTLR